LDIGQIFKKKLRSKLKVKIHSFFKIVLCNKIISKIIKIKGKVDWDIQMEAHYYLELVLPLSKEVKIFKDFKALIKMDKL
jgi:hypothetical protein